MTEIEWLGQRPYRDAWHMQTALVDARNADDTLPDKLLLLEHPPTYTLGSSADRANLLRDEATLAEMGIPVIQVNRGGDITYHGPGQLVGYPILNLKRLQATSRPDLHVYLRHLEQCLIDTLAHFDIAGWRYPGYTGVWVGDRHENPLKIAAIGIRVSTRGISSHGFALNIDPNMHHFEHIIPCGIREHGVTSMVQVRQRPLTLSDVLPVVKEQFQQTFQNDKAGTQKPTEIAQSYTENKEISSPFSV